MKRSSLTKNIYPRGNRYFIQKTINKEKRTFKSFPTLAEAIEYRDKLEANNWEQLSLTPEEIEEQEQIEYFKYIHIGSYKTQYVVSNGKYYGNVYTIEEALYYRDLVIKQGIDKRPYELDLITDNPYLDGLKFEVPDHLILPERNSKYGKGTIKQDGPACFKVYYGGSKNKRYICSCRTYEMAYYVREEMLKADWDKSQLQRIFDDYPKWYTQLLFLYQYILRETNKDGTVKYLLALPVKHNNGKLEHLIYYKLEDALYERDFLKEHGWDYDLLVETIDDRDNPYYDMDLPPYPTRKIRNIVERDYHEKEIMKIFESLYHDPTLSLDAVADIVKYTSPVIRRWLKEYYNITWSEFKEICVNGDNPLEVLDKQELIYQPDLSRTMPPNFNNYVTKKDDQYGVRYIVSRKGVYYGSFEDEKLAHKISNELAKVDWDKSKLEAIREKHNCKSKVNSKRWVYPNGKGWSVRRKNKDRRMVTYGTWRDKRIAVIVRDMLLEYGFCLDNMVWIEDIALWTVQMMDLYSSTMFGKSTSEDIIYLEADCQIPYAKPVPESDKVQVERYINGVRVYFGRYNEDKAREVVEFLEDNNWDKDLLKTMQEIGEI